MPVTYLEAFMLPQEVAHSAELGRQAAKRLAPLDAHEPFRFPHAVKHAAERFGHGTAAEIALECSVSPGRSRMDEARAYVARVLKERLL